MQGGRLFTGNSKDRGPVNNVAQDTYLMPFRLGQGRAFKDAGYDRDYQSEKKRDYGLVQKLQVTKYSYIQQSKQS